VYKVEDKIYLGVCERKRMNITDSEDPSVDGRIILKLNFEKSDEGHGTASIRLRLGTGGGLL
jgi:hypothetical protein